MTRRWFFQALAGATALMGAAKRMVAKPRVTHITIPLVGKDRDTVGYLYYGHGGRVTSFAAYDFELPAPILWMKSTASAAPDCKVTISKR